MKYNVWPLRTYWNGRGWEIEGEYQFSGSLRTTRSKVIQDLQDADIMDDYDACVAKVGVKRLDYNIIIINEDTHEPLFGLRKAK